MTRAEFERKLYRNLIRDIENFIMHNDHIPPRDNKILKWIENVENEINKTRSKNASKN